MLYQQIASNKRKTVGVMVGFLLLVGVIGAAIGYAFAGSALIGIIFAIVIGFVYMFVMLGQSADVVMSMNHAREITDPSQAPELWHIVEDMALVGKVPMPRVFIIEDNSPNAFATGNDPSNAAVAATTGLLTRLNREELEGVMAHEVSHIRNYDIRLQTVALALASVVSILANFGMHSLFWGGHRRRNDRDDSGGGVFEIVMMLLALLAVILGPLAAMIAQMALSRNREYLADASAVELTRNPLGLVNALEKISTSEPMQAADASSASMYIADPFKGKTWAHLFDTHPPIEERVKRLRQM
ncbi:zinc metalloprotease HtpX [Ligilactobacillus apodemi]|uniref:Protease HtpX homolog n=1 Tax=Ligilactobacillus apodemi DSM 16634 = JCM 16172 TaxID=1423724 RepID=A0A0R1U136_9LACO|nr:zinc metalloprotease HtpX [Ligilactobacillus apodemi]KRL84888.1 heat shock protein HtpX [Ligilactobacillus apodemi DSM 16634 = JCM 16172]MCR1901010.1 zinc metalloprotease HtpX [Ligilactobacillus apodemi]